MSDLQNWTAEDKFVFNPPAVLPAKIGPFSSLDDLADAAGGISQLRGRVVTCSFEPFHGASGAASTGGRRSSSRHKKRRQKRKRSRSKRHSRSHSRAKRLRSKH